MAAQVGHTEPNINGISVPAVIDGIRNGHRPILDPAVLERCNALNTESGKASSEYSENTKEDNIDVEVVEEKDAALSRNVVNRQRMARRYPTRKVSPQEVEQLEAVLTEALSNADHLIAAAMPSSSDDCCCPCHLKRGGDKNSSQLKPSRKAGHSLSNPHAAPRTQAAYATPDNTRPLSLRVRKAKYHPEAFDFWSYVASAPKTEIALLASIPIAAAIAVFTWSSIFGLI